MEEKYKKHAAYIELHRENVKKTYLVLRNHLPENIHVDLKKLDKIINEHDLSKFDEEEFTGYAEHYYGEQTEENNEKFNKSVEHHKYSNKHHAESWIKDNKIEYMPDEYIVEMVCDWQSFAYLDKNHLPADKWFEIYRHQVQFNPEIEEKILSLISLIKQSEANGRVQRVFEAFDKKKAELQAQGKYPEPPKPYMEKQSKEQKPTISTEQLEEEIAKVN